MKTTLCINATAPNGNIKPALIADLEDGILKEIDWYKSYNFAKTDDNIQLTPGKVSLWERDETYNTSIMSYISNAPYSILEVISPGFVFKKTKNNEFDKETLRQKLVEGFRPTCQIVDPDLDLLILINEKNDTTSCIHIQKGQYEYVNNILRMKFDRYVPTFVNFCNVRKDAIVSNHHSVPAQSRSFCLSKDAIENGSKLLVNDPVDVATKALDSFLNISKKSHDKSKNVPDQLNELIKTFMKDRAAGQYSKEIYREVWDVPEVLDELASLISKSDDIDDIISRSLESNTSLSKKCQDKAIETVIKSRQDQIDEMESKLSEYEEKLNKIETIDEEYDRKEKSLEEKYKSDSDRLEKEYEKKKTVHEDDLESFITECETTKKEKSTELEIFITNIQNTKESKESEISTLNEEIKRLTGQKTIVEKDVESIKDVLINPLMKESFVPLIIECIKVASEDNKNILSDIKSSFESSISELANSMKEIKITGSESKIETKPIPVKIFTPSKDTETIESINALTEGLSDNLERFIHGTGTSLADYIQSTIRIVHHLIIANDPEHIIPNCVSATLDGRLACSIDGSYADAPDLLDSIESSNCNIIVIDGILSDLNFKTFNYLCRNTKKILFFTTDDRALLDNAPPEIWNRSGFIDMSDEQIVKPVDCEYSKLSMSNVEIKSWNGETFADLTETGIITKKQQLQIGKIHANLTDDSKENQYLVDFIIQIAKCNGKEVERTAIHV